MIWLTKLDNKPILLNLDNIKYIEAIPDTLIQLINGESVIVKESIAEMRARSIEYRADILKHSQNTTSAQADA